MWCLSYPSGGRSFHPTKEAAEAAAGDRDHVVWFDSFDYETHNPGRYAQRVAQERATGRAHVAQLLADLRRRLGLEMEEA